LGFDNFGAVYSVAPAVSETFSKNMMRRYVTKLGSITTHTVCVSNNRLIVPT
jgi:hypothetical protein